MKKFLTLLLAMMMALCTLTPALAETDLSNLFSSFTNPTTEEEAFPYTIDDYKLYFNMMASGMLESEPVWSVVDGNHVCALEGYGTVVVEMNAQGQVIRLKTDMSFTMESLSNAQQFGMLVALTAISSKAAEDINFILNNDSEDYTNQLVSCLTSLMGNIAEAANGPISSTAEVYGDTVTFTCALDIATMTVTFGFTYEP